MLATLEMRLVGEVIEGFLLLLQAVPELFCSVDAYMYEEGPAFFNFVSIYCTIAIAVENFSIYPSSVCSFELVSSLS